MSYFVFGSNKSGIHGAGAARYALDHLGAEWGVGEGITGQCYALPTKGFKIENMTLTEIEPHIEKFLTHAKEHSRDIFILTPVGCGLAGHLRSDIMRILVRYGVSDNVVFHKEWFIPLSAY